MTPPSRRRLRSLTSSLALAAATLLAAAPMASAQSALTPEGTIAAGSLGSVVDTSLPASGSLGSLAPVPYAEYVAMGDSYAALGDNREPAGGPEVCGRSLANYPQQLDATDARVGELTDVTCGGATIPDFANQRQDAPPQYEALGAGTDLVTVSIGGNDVGFGMIVGCITRQGPFEGLATTCENAIGEDVDADIETVFSEGGAIDGVYAEIEERSPGATVIATQYMPLMPAAGTSCAFTDRLHPADVQWAREITEAINDAVDAAATRHGHVSVMPTDTVDRSACAPADQRWTSFMGEGDNTAAMHPTALGQAAMASAIADEL